MNEVVIVSAVRTPIGKLGGVLSAIRPDDVAALVIKEAVQRAGIDPGEVDEVYMGCANQAGEDNRNVARMGLLLAGIPQHVDLRVSGTLTWHIHQLTSRFHYQPRAISAILTRLSFELTSSPCSGKA